MPTAGYKSTKHAGPAGRFVQVKGLWIELRRKCFDTAFFHPISPGSEALADAQILQIQTLGKNGGFGHLLSPESVQVARAYGHAHFLQIGEQLVFVIDKMFQITQQQRKQWLAVLHKDGGYRCV